jgi:eukaryotic-like serine/threonine-protein kinase
MRDRDGSEAPTVRRRGTDDPAAGAENPTARPRDPTAGLEHTRSRIEDTGPRIDDTRSRVDDTGPRIEDRRPRSDAPVVLARYRLRRRLGAGGFATVWLARDERLDREVAIKILPRERVVGGRFEREARAAARLAHPGIVTLYEAAVDDEGAYLVSESVHGGTLDELLAAGRLSDRDVVHIGVALCDALSHAHGQGIIHRDVKPSNILIPERPTTPAQLARLTDFGVARILDSHPPSSQGESLTRTGDVIGTAAYMAPEQAQGLPAGPAADLFSLALVMYEALSGVNPLRTQAGALVRHARAGAHLPPLRRQRRDLPRELGRAIDLALRPRASERGTLEELRGALVSAATRVSDEPGVVEPPWPQRTLTWPAADEEYESHDAIAAEEEHEGRRGMRRASRARPSDQPVEQSDREGRQPHAATRVGGHPVPWPRRALAGVATAAMTAWLAHHVPGASPIPAPLTACVAGALVAALPRLGWLIVTAAISGSLAAHSRPGPALLLLVAALVPVLLSPRDGPAWPVAATAVGLNAIGLATAWPALAGFAGTARRRVVLAATGWIWIELVRQTQTQSQGLATVGSLHDAVQHVLRPLLTIGTPATCAAWAFAALVLPLTRIRRSPELEYIRIAAWATGLALLTIATVGLGGAGTKLSLGAALLGAYLGALVAVATRRVVMRVSGHRTAERMRSNRVA